MSNKKNYFSIAEAARALGMTRGGVHAAIRQKRLKAKHGIFEVERTFKIKGWVIEESDLREFEVSLRHQDAGKKNE